MRIALGGGERGMAKQFLDRTQIATRRKQVRGEAVAEGMRRGGFG